jgi:hypothetical protein
MVQYNNSLSSLIWRHFQLILFVTSMKSMRSEVIILSFHNLKAFWNLSLRYINEAHLEGPFHMGLYFFG